MKHIYLTDLSEVIAVVLWVHIKEVTPPVHKAYICYRMLPKWSVLCKTQWEMQMLGPFLKEMAGPAINCMQSSSSLRSPFHNSKYSIIGTAIKYVILCKHWWEWDNSIPHPWEIYTAVCQWLISTGKLISTGSGRNTDHLLLCKY